MDILLVLINVFRDEGGIIGIKVQIIIVSTIK